MNSSCILFAICWNKRIMIFRSFDDFIKNTINFYCYISKNDYLKNYRD